MHISFRVISGLILQTLEKTIFILMMFGLEPGVNFILFPLTIIRNYPSPEKCSVLSSSSCFGHAKVLTDNSGLTDMFNQETQKAACFKAINSELEDFSTIVLLVILEH